MIDTLDTVPDGAVLEADICIVGAGLAGVALAHGLRGRGLQVMLLEACGLDDAGVAPSVVQADGPEWRGRAGGCGPADFGASTLYWAGQCLPLTPADFARRDGLAGGDWPIGMEVLAPFQRRASAFLRIGDGVAEPGHLPAPGFDPARLQRVTALSRLPAEAARAFTAEFRAAPDCRAVLHARVLRIETDAQARRVRALRLRRRSGGTVRVRAQAFVLCAGGIGTVRLLLASDDVQRCGLGNGRDWVGRCFQGLPAGGIGVLQARDAALLQAQYRPLRSGGCQGVPGLRLGAALRQRAAASLAYAHFEFGGAEMVDARLRALLRPVREGRLPPRPLREPGRLTADPRRVVGAASRRLLPAATPPEVRLRCRLEQLPDPANRLTRLDTAADGLPRLRLHWRLGAAEQRAARLMAEAVTTECARLGLGRVRPAAALAGEGWQDLFSGGGAGGLVAGTARMAATPAQGVVDPDGAVFGLHGLYVCGAATFPSTGIANPALAEVALALRLADHLGASLRSAKRAAA